MNFVRKNCINSNLNQKPECNIHINQFLSGEVQSSPVSSLGFSPCKNVVRLLRYVCEVQHHLLLNRSSKTSLSQFSCCCVRLMGAEAPDPGCGQPGQQERGVEGESAGGGGGVSSLCCGRNLPLLMSQDQFTETVTETHCTNSSRNQLCQIQTQSHFLKVNIIALSPSCSPCIISHPYMFRVGSKKVQLNLLASYFPS